MTLYLKPVGTFGSQVSPTATTVAWCYNLSTDEVSTCLVHNLVLGKDHTVRQDTSGPKGACGCTKPPYKQ
jgi:hypothetical protein